CTTMNFNATIKSVPEYLVLSVRDIIPNYASEGLLWERICQLEASKFAKVGGACFAIYYDEGYKEANVDVEVVVEVDQPFENGKDYTCRKTEAVKTMVSVLVPGDFSHIAEGFAFAGEWIEQNGYQIAGESRQATLRGPWNESDPANYLTEVQIPVKKD
ncbi:MAG: GyrI-like domain-containing protein, partial [Eubacteriales bacterium]